MRSPTRTWCAASALAARTVTSRVLASPSRPPLAPTSVTASTRISTELSSSALVPTECTWPVRSVVRQLTRRSRSPGWKRPDRVELRPVAAAPRPVLADQAHRVRRLARAEASALGERGHRGLGETLWSPPVAAPGRGRGHDRRSGGPLAPASRADDELEPGGVLASTGGDGECSGGRLDGDVGRGREGRGHLLDPRRRRDVDLEPGALSLVEPPVGDPHLRGHRTSRQVGDGEGGGQPEGRGEHEQLGAPERHRREEDDDRGRDRPHQRGRGPPLAPQGRLRHRDLSSISRAAGLGTVSSRRVTISPPVTSVIQSSGFTTIRCARTAGATALTSSGSA